MASFKMMSSSTSRNSDLSRRNSSSASSSPTVRSNHLRRDPHADHSKITFAYGGGNDATLHDYNFASDSLDVDRSNGDRNSVNGGGRKSVDDVWKEIVSGEKKTVLKEEAQDEYMMTLEDFLAQAAEMNGNDDEIDVKIPMSPSGTFDYPMMPQQQHNQVEMVEVSTRRKRGRVMVEAMDKAAAQRQKRMIKNRESAARSRERKQAYQVELETLAAKLERENEQLLKEIEEKTRERYKNLMEQLIPVDDEKRKPSSSASRSLSRSHSLEW
ncbi:hypothetical protein Bca4012_069670 [Brassica carinata]|uniref:BnaC05g02200D protein n=2 Tax=Brassica napus TaxID=3708 RepID=A0A078FZJ9_BRANA|nr:G-box-binding factor 4-like [Brassica napus]KAH0876547.1 hypothetical protein HID58_063941 [Brassica napus]CAF1923633.1 unnamed protein product [Brassica napus]CDY18197.1 BnaC05g02200D [Brassica napus]